MNDFKTRKEWLYCSVHDFQYNSLNGEACLSWYDDISNIKLKANMQGVVFFQQSNLPRESQLTLAYELVIDEIKANLAFQYLQKLGYGFIDINKQLPKLYHLHIESDVILDIVCEELILSHP